MKKMTRMISFVMVLVMMFTMISSICCTVSAASAYDCKITRTITVKTGNGKTTPSIKFTCKPDKELKNIGISAFAPKMSLKIYDHTTGKTTWKRITGYFTTISSTLKLEKNKTYTITVSYLYDAKLNKNSAIVGGGNGWVNGTWCISSTKNITSLTVNKPKK